MKGITKVCLWWGGVMVMWKMLVGLGRCDSCQEKCQSSVRCERY